MIEIPMELIFVIPVLLILNGIYVRVRFSKDGLNHEMKFFPKEKDMFRIGDEVLIKDMAFPRILGVVGKIRKIDGIHKAHGNTFLHFGTEKGKRFRLNSVNVKRIK